MLLLADAFKPSILRYQSELSRTVINNLVQLKNKRLS